MRFCLFTRVFYVPVSEIQEALDAFLLLNGILYILQFTVDQNHSIKPGFVKFLQKCECVPPLEKALTHLAYSLIHIGHTCKRRVPISDK
jgi:hypothetical protein